MDYCRGCDCIYFDAVVDVITGDGYAYCKKQKVRLGADYENRRVYAGEKCEPVLRVIRFANGDVIGAESWHQYR